VRLEEVFHIYLYMFLKRGGVTVSMPWQDRGERKRRGEVGGVNVRIGLIRVVRFGEFGLDYISCLL